jgi:hypothetical protein
LGWIPTLEKIKPKEAQVFSQFFNEFFDDKVDKLLNFFAKELKK